MFSPSACHPLLPSSPFSFSPLCQIEIFNLPSDGLKNPRWERTDAPKNLYTVCALSAAVLLPLIPHIQDKPLLITVVHLSGNRQFWVAISFTYFFKYGTIPTTSQVFLKAIRLRYISRSRQNANSTAQHGRSICSNGSVTDPVCLTSLS